MKSILLLLLPSLLFASKLIINYGAYYFGNELAGIYQTTSLDYTTYDFAPDYSSLTMVDVIRNFTSNTWYDPSPELKDIGCTRKLHITSDERFYCTDDVNQLLIGISSELPFRAVEIYILGFPNTDFDDWLDPDTQYLVFVYGIEAPGVYNFTVFDTTNNQFFAPIIINTTELLGETNYGIEGYFITDDVIGFGIEDLDAKRPTEVWQSQLTGSQEKSRISTSNVTDIHRIIVLNYTNVIFIHENNLYTTEISSGNMSTFALDSTISDINKINHTHFTVSAGTEISVFTVDANNQLIQTGSVDLSAYLKNNNFTLNPPDCCAGQGFLQAWVQEPEQNSYFMLDQNTLEVNDYITPYQYNNSDAPYFPLFYLGNETIVRPSYNGYILMATSTGKPITFVSVPLQDVYYDPSNDDLVFGFYSGATKDYPNITSCYLLVIQTAESNFTTINFPHCPNPTLSSSIDLLDVQCDRNWNCNLVYQALNGIYVIREQVPYLIESKVAQFGDVLAFPFNASQVAFVGLIPDVYSTMGQIFIETFDLTTGHLLSTKVLSGFGTVAKIDPYTVMYSFSNLLQTTVNVYNVVAGASSSTNTVSQPLVSGLVPLAGGQSFVTLTPSGNATLYQPNGSQLSGSPVSYNSLGSAFVKATGQNSFILLTYCSGMQEVTLYSLYDETVIEI